MSPTRAADRYLRPRLAIVDRFRQRFGSPVAPRRRRAAPAGAGQPATFHAAMQQSAHPGPRSIAALRTANRLGTFALAPPSLAATAPPRRGRTAAAPARKPRTAVLPRPAAIAAHPRHAPETQAPHPLRTQAKASPTAPRAMSGAQPAPAQTSVLDSPAPRRKVDAPASIASPPALLRAAPGRVRAPARTYDLPALPTQRTRGHADGMPLVRTAATHPSRLSAPNMAATMARQPRALLVMNPATSPARPYLVRTSAGHARSASASGARAESGPAGLGAKRPAGPGPARSVKPLRLAGPTSPEALARLGRRMPSPLTAAAPIARDPDEPAINSAAPLLRSMPGDASLPPPRHEIMSDPVQADLWLARSLAAALGPPAAAIAFDARISPPWFLQGVA